MNTDYKLSKVSENRGAVLVLSNFFNRLGLLELRNANLVCFPPDSSPVVDCFAGPVLGNM